MEGAGRPHRLLARAAEHPTQRGCPRGAPRLRLLFLHVPRRGGAGGPAEAAGSREEDVSSPAACAPAAMGAAVAKGAREQLLGALKSLEGDALRLFRGKLREFPVRQGFDRIPPEKLQEASPVELSDLLLDYYSAEYAVEVTAELLSAINCPRQAEELLEAAAASGEREESRATRRSLRVGFGLGGVFARRSVGLGTEAGCIGLCSGFGGKRSSSGGLAPRWWDRPLQTSEPQPCRIQPRSCFPRPTRRLREPRR